MCLLKLFLSVNITILATTATGGGPHTHREASIELGGPRIEGIDIILHPQQVSVSQWLKLMVGLYLSVSGDTMPAGCPRCPRLT